MDCSPPDSSVHVILQARILEWGAICYSRRSSRPRDWTCVFCISCIDGEILYHWAIWEALACFSRSVNQSVFSSLKSRGCAKQPLRHHPVWASWNLKPKEVCGCWVFIVYTGCHILLGYMVSPEGLPLPDRADHWMRRHCFHAIQVKEGAGIFFLGKNRYTFRCFP